MAAMSTILLGAALAGTLYQMEEGRAQRKEAKREMGRQAAENSRMQAQQVEKEKVMNEQSRQRKYRERQRAVLAAKAGGRQSTILGGAGDVGNSGNQAQSGAGKTLLGV